MGISGLWDVLGKGEEYAIADYAAAHWERHKRPLRVAVDEACWRFNNLSEEQVARIREGEPAANPIEKTILWRILRLWKMNIQLLFVTDGLKKPGKKRWGRKTSGGRGGGKVDKDVIKMLHQMFDRLHVPYHMAPGEAEAECARLQQLGVVDAVWSDDGDCLMFGCTTLLKAHTDSAGKKDWHRIRVYCAETVLPRFDFDTDSLVMFAVVTGGDYDVKGLPNCGPQKAKILCQREVGLARTLRQCGTKRDFDAWRYHLTTTIQEMGYAIRVAPEFPYVKALDGYRNPAVSAEERCRNLRGLHAKEGGWEWFEDQMDQTKLRLVLRSHYNLSTREFLKHLGPVFLARALTRNITPARKEENLSYGLALRRTQNRKGENGEDIYQPAEVNIKFNPFRLVQIDLSEQPPEEDWSCTIKNDGMQYDPMKSIDGVMLSCFLAHGLPDGALEKPAKSPMRNGRKAKDDKVPDDLDTSRAGPSTSQKSPTAKKMKKPSASNAAIPDAHQSESTEAQPNTKKRKSQSENADESTKSVKKPRKSKTAEKTPSLSPPPATFRRLQIPNLVTKKPTEDTSKRIPEKCLVIDLDDDSESDGVQGSAHVAANGLKRHSKYNSANVHVESRPVTNTAGSDQTSKNKQQTPLRVEPVCSMAPMQDYEQMAASRASRLGGQTSTPPQMSLAPTASYMERLALPSSSATVTLDMNVTPSAASLRQRRELGLLSKLSMPAVATDHALESSVATIATLPIAPPTAPRVSSHGVIDLT